MILTSTHHQGPSHQRAAIARTKPVIIGDGVWIGAGSVILPGVQVGAGAVIAAGSVVNRDCEPDAMYAGVPARKVRSL
ncbi:DapH/DapD/GlmU-related protein [Microbacterium oleivorans]|uniref:acyltransferase n=1 Tax=Microbacterium oleivorans TaxID=273677 RepID=UPI0018D4C309